MLDKFIILLLFLSLVSSEENDYVQDQKDGKESADNLPPFLEDNGEFSEQVPFPGSFPGIHTGSNPSEQFDENPGGQEGSNSGGHAGSLGHSVGNAEEHSGPVPPLNNKKCIDNIYRKCNRARSFTQQQLDNVRQYLFQTFNRAEVKPDNNLCTNLRIRRNWKCLTDSQRNRTIAVWQQMYDSGIIAKFTDTYSKNWATWHKSTELVFAMRRLTNQFEQAMMAIDPRVTLPYWEPWQYATHPELSSVWNDLGTSGNYEGGYCVEDGSFTEYIPCLRRHWSPRGSIYPYSSPEFITEMIQNSKGVASIVEKSFALVFQHAIAIGGYEGQLSSRDAAYDPIFWMSWAAFLDLAFFRWQLQDDTNLCPLSYDFASYKYNQSTGVIENSDIQTDTITGIPNSSIRENCWLGFGDLCYIPDQLINVIDLIQTNQKDPTCPVAVQRIRSKSWLAAKYFPRIYLGNVTRLDHVFEEVGECNPMCDPITKPTYLHETEAGRKVAEEFAYSNGLDIGVALSEQPNYQLWLELNRAGYCSPYVTRCN